MTESTTATSRVNAARRVNVCASCGATAPSTDKRRAAEGWYEAIRQGVVVARTCGGCPRPGEPVYRVETKGGEVRYRVKADAATSGGKRRQLTYTATTLDGARDWLAGATRAREAGAAVNLAGETLGQLLDRWLAGKTDVRRITREGYVSSLAPVRERLGSKRVTELTVADVQQLIAWMQREGKRHKRPGVEGGVPMSANSIKHARTPLQQALDLALVEETVTRNVAKLATWPKVRGQRGLANIVHWQPDELLAFRDAADQHPLAGAWRLTLAGLTRSEVMGLRWADVDLEAGTVTIARGRVQLNSGDDDGDPKSEQRWRTVPVESMHPGTVALLRQLMAAQEVAMRAAGRSWHHSDYVVVDELGYPLRPEVYSDRFRRVCREAGVPTIKLHNVRHSLAFTLHAAGVTPADAAALLGHSVEVHMAHYLPASKGSGIARAAEALGGALNPARSEAVGVE